MKMSAEQLQAKWDEVIELINNTFEGKRKDNILKMYEYFKDRMMFAPASGIPRASTMTPSRLPVVS